MFIFFYHILIYFGIISQWVCHHVWCFKNWTGSAHSTGNRVCLRFGSPSKTVSPKKPKKLIWTIRTRAEPGIGVSFQKPTNYQKLTEVASLMEMVSRWRQEWTPTFSNCRSHELNIRNHVVGSDEKVGCQRLLTDMYHRRCLFQQVCSTPVTLFFGTCSRVWLLFAHEGWNGEGDRCNGEESEKGWKVEWGRAVEVTCSDGILDVTPLFESTLVDIFIFLYSCLCLFLSLQTIGIGNYFVYLKFWLLVLVKRWKLHII